MKTRKEVANNCPRHTGTFKSCNPNCVAPHTPTPWIAKPHKGDIKLMATIGGADGIQIAYTTPENAAFIVRACNGVEAVLKTGDALLEKIGMISGIEKERVAFINALKAISND